MSIIRAIFDHREPDFSDLAIHGAAIEKDWENAPVNPAARFLFWATDSHFYFLAGREKSALSHPEARENEFRAELWKYDVAEFFLMREDGKGYLEFNLSPPGAWWSCRFDEARKMSPGEPQALIGVKIRSEDTPTGWQAMAAIPRETLSPLEGARINVCFILDSPDQIFLTAAPSTPGEPDFHQPEGGLPLVIREK